MKKDNRKTLKEFINTLGDKKTRLYIGEETSFYLVCSAEHLLENEQKLIKEMKEIAEKLFRKDEAVLLTYYHGIDVGTEDFSYITEVQSQLQILCSNYRKTNNLYTESKKWRNDLFTGKKVKDHNERIDKTGINVVLEGKGRGQYWDGEEWNRSNPDIDPEKLMKELVSGNVRNRKSNDKKKEVGE